MKSAFQTRPSVDLWKDSWLYHRHQVFWIQADPDPGWRSDAAAAMRHLWAYARYYEHWCSLLVSNTEFAFLLLNASRFLKMSSNTIDLICRVIRVAEGAVDLADLVEYYWWKMPSLSRSWLINLIVFVLDGVLVKCLLFIAHTLMNSLSIILSIQLMQLTLID